MGDVPPEQVVHLLAADPQGRAVVVEHGSDGGLRLPILGRTSDLETHAQIAALLAGYLGHPHPILRAVPVSADAQGPATDVLVVSEPVTDRDPQPAAWVLITDPRVAALRGAAGIGGHVSRWLDEVATGVSDRRRQRWERPGFEERARAWMCSELEAAGTPVQGTPTVERLWTLSAMLRAETTGGRAYLKACARVFDAEPAGTAALHRVTPGAVPEVVATDAAEGWLLMRDAGGVNVGDGPAETWHGALGALAAIQQATGHALDGVALEDRGPVALATALPRLLETAFVAGFPEDIGPRFRAAGPRLLDACHRLASLGPGPTVVHGDYHPWNVLRAGQRFVVLDWSDMATGHPFIDLANWLTRVSDRAARRSMLDEWLACWADAAPRAELEEAAQLALPVGALHQVESYRRIVESLEPGADWGIAGAGPAFARWALAWLDDGLDAAVPR